MALTDFPSISKYVLGYDAPDGYAHIVSEAFDSVLSEFNKSKDAIGVFSKGSINDLTEDCDGLNSIINSFNAHKTLNEKFWVNGKINSRVRLRLLDIADDFFDSMEVGWVKPKDIVLTGSIANYNWSKYSDVDLHIIIDFKEVDERVEFVKDYFDSKRKIWNNSHENLTIYGFPVELYVQDSNEEHVASGVYSLERNKWIKEPEYDGFKSVSLNKQHIIRKVCEIMKRIDGMERALEKEKDTQKISQLSDKVYALFRKLKGMRSEGLKKSGEMSEENIIFKVLRRCGYIGKLVDMKTKTYDRINMIR